MLAGWPTRARMRDDPGLGSIADQCSANYPYQRRANTEVPTIGASNLYCLHSEPWTALTRQRPKAGAAL